MRNYFYRIYSTPPPLTRDHQTPTTSLTELLNKLSEWITYILKVSFLVLALRSLWVFPADVPPVLTYIQQVNSTVSYMFGKPLLLVGLKISNCIELFSRLLLKQPKLPEITLPHYILTQKIMLHGHEARCIRYIPKVRETLLTQLIKYIQLLFSYILHYNQDPKHLRFWINLIFSHQDWFKYLLNLAADSEIYQP